MKGILCVLSEKLIVGGIFCDLAKASDCSTHDISLLKLNCYVIDGKTNEWIKSIIHFQVDELKNMVFYNDQFQAPCSFYSV